GSCLLALELFFTGDTLVLRLLLRDTALLLCLLTLHFLALGVRLPVLLALRLRLLASLFSEHHLDVVDGASGLAHLVAALDTRDLDVLALGHALQQTHQPAERPGDAAADQPGQESPYDDRDSSNPD